MSTTGKVIWWVAFVWIFLLSISTFPYLSFRSNYGFLELKQAAVRSGWYLPAFYCHIWGSSLILLAGFFQFLPAVYRRRKLHKALGKLYVFGILFFASPGGFVMTMFINRGAGVCTSFLIQNALWIIFTLSAWITIRKGNVDNHVKMMRRSYALAFAAVTLRFYIWLLQVSGHGLAFEHNYLIIAFLSWVPNLVFVEFLNRRTVTPVLEKDLPRSPPWGEDRRSHER